MIQTISSANWPLEFRIRGTYKCVRYHTYWGLKITEACNPKWSSEFVRESGVPRSLLWNEMSLFIKIIAFYNPIRFLAILYPTSPANLVVEVGIGHSHENSRRKGKDLVPVNINVRHCWGLFGLGCEHVDSFYQFPLCPGYGLELYQYWWSMPGLLKIWPLPQPGHQ